MSWKPTSIVPPTVECDDPELHRISLGRSHRQPLLTTLHHTRPLQRTTSSSKVMIIGYYSSVPSTGDQ